MKKLDLCNNLQLESVAFFNEMLELEELSIARTNVKSLKPIINLTKLKQIYCTWTPISEEDIIYFNLNNKSKIKAQDWI